MYQRAVLLIYRGIPVEMAIFRDRYQANQLFQNIDPEASRRTETKCDLKVSMIDLRMSSFT